MLSAQVEYWKLQENARHNLVAEEQGWFNAKEQQRHNVVGEQVNWFTAQESQRHNLASESETQRHNVQTEKISWGTLEENKRHNIASENLGYLNYQESVRSHLVNEGISSAGLAETVRSHKASEAIGWENAESQALQARTARLNADINQQNVELGWARLGVEQQRADTAQYIAEYQEGQGERRLDYQFMGYGIDSYEAGVHQQQADTQLLNVIWGNLLKTGELANDWYNSLTRGDN